MKKQVQPVIAGRIWSGGEVVEPEREIGERPGGRPCRQRRIVKSA